MESQSSYAPFHPRRAGDASIRRGDSVARSHHQDSSSDSKWAAKPLFHCSQKADRATVILLIFYSFHPHASPSMLLPQLPRRIQPLLHQIVFFAGSISAGCYLIYATNEHGHYAVMKRAPSVGTLWIWSVIELDILWAVPSLVFCVGFLKWNDYSFT